MDKLIDSTLLPLLIKSVAFLALAFALWPIARRQSAAFQSVYWRGAMLGLAVLAAFSLWVPIVTIEWPANAAANTHSPAAVAPDSSQDEWRNLTASDNLAISPEAVGTAPASSSNNSAEPSFDSLYLWYHSF